MRTMGRAWWVGLLGTTLMWTAGCSHLGLSSHHEHKVAAVQAIDVERKFGVPIYPGAAPVPPPSPQPGQPAAEPTVDPNLAELTTADPFEHVVDFYRHQMADAPLNIVTVGGLHSAGLVVARQGRQISLALNELRDGGTSIQIGAHEGLTPLTARPAASAPSPSPEESRTPAAPAATTPSEEDRTSDTPAATPAEGRTPEHPTATPAEGRAPDRPAVPPADGRTPARQAAAPAEGRTPDRPAATHAERRPSYRPAATPADRPAPYRPAATPADRPASDRPGPHPTDER